MKKINLNSLVKEKLTGDEVGRLMMMDSLSLYKSAMEDIDVAEERRPPKTLFSENEAKQIKGNLNDPFSIEKYNSYCDLLHFLKYNKLESMIAGYEIEILLWRLAFIFSSNKKRTESNLYSIEILIQIAIFKIKMVLFFNTLVDLAIKLTDIPDLQLLKSTLPEDLLPSINGFLNLVNEENDIKLTNIILSEIHQPLKENSESEKVLTEITRVSDLYEKKEKLKTLIMGEKYDTVFIPTQNKNL